MKEIQVGSLVEFLNPYSSKSIPNVGIVLEIVCFDDLLGVEFSRGMKWYSVLFGDVDMVVSSEMIILVN